jgi:hypothetical protein
MAITSNTYTGNGSTVLFSITFPYLDTTDVFAYINGTLTTAYTFANATTIQFNTAPANGATILLNRQTNDSELQATFFPGSSIKASDLNQDFDQVLYIAQETTNVGDTAFTTANTALANSITAVSTANTASSNASAAVSTANTASTNASNAVTTANTASSNATTAVNTANAATSTANSAASNASTALSTANTALTNANSAVTTANTASSNATAAVSTANAANSTANTADTNASAAVVTANTATATANTATATANAATTAANAAIVKADQAINLGSKSFGDLYTTTAGAIGSKLIDLGDLTTGCALDYFTGESGGGRSFTCALGCSVFSLGSV